MTKKYTILVTLELEDIRPGLARFLKRVLREAGCTCTDVREVAVTTFASAERAKVRLTGQAGKDQSNSKEL